MRTGRNLLRHRGVQAGVAALAAGGVFVGVGAAGAAQDTTITAVGAATEGQWDKRAVTIQTGDTVTWAFADPTHNVGANNTQPQDPRWVKAAPLDKGWFEPGPSIYDAAPQGAEYEYTFYKSGTYDFLCVLHPNMTGTITVEGEDKEPPTGTPVPTQPPPTPTQPPPTPTQPPTATPIAPTQPTNPNRPVEPGRDVVTPAPSPDESDTTAPRVRSIKVSGKRRLVTVRFRLSEDATVAVQVSKRGSRKSLRTIRVQARAGTRTIKVRSGQIRRGKRYTVQVNARDAMGNRFAADAAAVRIKRR